jgi:hypothetical protein
MARRGVAFVAASAALAALAAAGGWDFADCRDGERAAVAEIVDKSTFAASSPIKADVGSAKNTVCPEGCFCAGSGSANVQFGLTKGCLPLLYAANGTGLAGNPACKCQQSAIAYKRSARMSARITRRRAAFTSLSTTRTSGR